MSESNKQRIEECFNTHYSSILSYFVRRCPNVTDAEDATTAVFTVAWRKIHKLPDEPDTRLWLFGVARRVLADQRRSATRRERLTARITAEQLPQSAPDYVASTVETLAIRTAFQSLSDSDRDLLALVAWEGLSPAEIAEVLNTPAPVISARLYRARRRLAKRLETLDRRTEQCLT